MTERQSRLAGTAEDLRRSFDESFAAAPEASARHTQDFLAIRVCGGRYALRVADLAGLAGHRKIVPLPSADPALLGIAGTHGQLVPVYRLASFVDSGGGQEESAWLAVCGRDEPVALAFAALERHLRVPTVDLYASDKDERRFVREALRLGSEVRYVLDVPSILAAIRDRAGVSASVTGR